MKIEIPRRKTREIKVGHLKIGGDNPILIQSMTNTDTKDSKATIDQIKRLEKAGCEIIRVSVPDEESALSLKEIKKNINIPLVADIHFDWKMAIESIKNGADEIRINPGNIGNEEKVKLIAEEARKNNVAIRVGINAGSLQIDILHKYNDKITPEGLVESAMRSINLLEKFGNENLVISIKSTDVLMTIKSHEILASKGDWPFHIGITEAGRARAGIVKSSLGIGGLLLKGMGDTLRVSLSGDPEEEVKVGWDILKSLGLREKGLTVISCPTCSRTKIPVEDIAKYLEDNSDSFGDKPIKIAVMGCIVNGLGEAKEADLAFVGIEKGKASFFKKGEFVENLEPDKIKSFIEDLIKFKKYEDK